MLHLKVEIRINGIYILDFRGFKLRKTDALLSDDRQYRFWLLRIWDDCLPVQCSCGINPSTADERDNDPTIRKDIGFASRSGFGGILKVNVCAYRAAIGVNENDHDIGYWNVGKNSKGRLKIVDFGLFF